MTLRITLLFYLIINSISYAREYNHAIDSLSHIRIDSIILFDDPYIICNAEHEKKGFVPVWRKAYDATSVPTPFNRNADEGIKFLHSSLNVDISELQDFYNTWVPKPDPNIDLTWYVLGDIYFYDEITEKNYIFSPAWGGSYHLPVRLSQLDINQLGLVHKSKLDTCDYYYPFYRDDHGTYSFYIEEGKVVRKCDALLLYEICRWKPEGVGGSFSSFKGFLELIRRQDFYIRSRVENGKRIFETVNNPP
ncbi:hypothetical protein KEM09_03520 [Carboxylicivirga mesophila]|uniref:GLPGLI family protein n=1 Tax=Carboxylicivirga mesophila TaxID=1166478 RepID=A0ABS5K6B7_9BACT|nr:hypothetical protein [Carboxylicivirga mesophila]MBS2210452.1 hypothetical protein [Carboxylicivirga mesophila]